MLGWVQRLDQYRATTVLHGLIIIAAVMVVIDELVRSAPDESTIYSSAAGLLITGFSLFLHLKRWRYSAEVLIIAIAALIGIAISEPSLSQETTPAVMVPTVIAALVSKRKSPILWGTALTLGILLYRAGGHGAYSDPSALIIIGLLVGGIFLTRIVLENTAAGKAEAERLRQVLETYLKSLGEGVVAIDRYWKITLFNPAAEHISGWKKEEAIGKPFREILKFIRVNDRSENIIFIERAMVEGKAGYLTDDTVLITKDGREVPVGDSAAPLINSQTNQIQGAIIVFRDMTAERAAAALGSDFAYAQHQMRTPLGAAVVTLQSIEMLDDVNQIKQQVSASLPQLKSVQQMVEESLEFLKAEHEPQPPKVTQIDLVAAVKESVESVKTQYVSTIWDINLPVGPVMLASDTELLKKSLGTVLNNAAMYNEASQPVRVGLESNDRHIITVSNAGAIPEQEQGTVFAKFFRGSNKPASSTGAGLGLYLAKQYLTKIGGKIWFSSDPKNGTKFFISLPK